MPVYMVRADEDGPVKIGWSTRVAGRMQEIAPTPETQLTIIRLLHVPRWVEPWLHRQFAKHRLQGEWFNFDEKMLTIEPPSELPDKSRSEVPIRLGTLLHFPENIGVLARAVALAEDRPIQRIMSRALHAYAASSPEYQATLARDTESESASE